MNVENKRLASLDQFLRLDRFGTLRMSLDGSLLIGSVQYVDESEGRRTALYRLAQDADELPRCIAHFQGPVSDFRIAANRQIYVSKASLGEPTQELVEVDPTTGAQRVVAKVHGVRSLGPIPHTDDILLVGAVRTPGSGEGRHLGGARLHSHYPVRGEDSDEVESIQFQILDTRNGVLKSIPSHQNNLDLDGNIVTAPTGRFVLANQRRYQHAEIRLDLVLLDLTSGTSAVIHSEDELRMLPGPISSDGRRAVVQVVRLAEPSERRSLAVVDLETRTVKPLAPEWDRWPTPMCWFPDDNSVLVRADEHGRTPLFRLSVDTEEVTRLTDDEGAYDGAVIDPAHNAIYAVRSHIGHPGEAVRIDPPGVRKLGLPLTQPRFPGTAAQISVPTRDHIELHCQLIMPPATTSKGPFPLAVWIHGGPAVSWAGWRWARSPWPLVARGYAVLMPDIAMSTGYGQSFIDRGWGDWGGAPFRDLIDATAAVATRPDIDSERIAVIGTSFGGYLASWAVANSDMFRAAVAHAAPWDLEQFHPTTDDPARFRRRMKPSVRREHSPRWKVADINVPMLVSQGGQDTCIPREQAFLQWHDLLSLSGLAANADGHSPHRFLYLPDEGHRITSIKGTRAWYEALLGFLDEHLLGQQPMYHPELLEHDRAAPEGEQPPGSAGSRRQGGWN